MILPILLDVLAPILLMIAAGALLRYQFKIDLGTLSKLNLYLLVPAFVFDKVSTSTLSWAQMGGVVTIGMVPEEADVVPPVVVECGPVGARDPAERLQLERTAHEPPRGDRAAVDEGDRSEDPVEGHDARVRAEQRLA